VNAGPSVQTEPRRSNRGPAIAWGLCLVAIVPVLGIFTGIAAVWLSILRVIT